MKHVPVQISATQVRALKKGGAIIMKPSMLVEGGKHSLALSEPTIKKLMMAMKKGKGMRMMLDETVGEGIVGAGNHVPSGQKKGEKRGIAVRSMVGDGHQDRGDRERERLAMEVHDLKKGRGQQDRGDREDERLAMKLHDLKHGGNIFTKAAKSVSKGAKKATKSVSKAAKSASKSAGKAAKKGAKAAGKAAKDVSKSPEFQALAKVALEEGGKMAGTALGAELGDPELGMSVGSTLGRVGADQVGVKKSDRTSQLAASTLREGSAAAERSGVAASHPLSTALAKRVVERQMGERKMGEGMRSYSARMILPSSDEMTMSPFARVNSAQMSPYIHSSPQLARRIVRGNGMHYGDGMHGMGMHGGNMHYGGNIFPPGQQGGSIYPSGSSVHTIGQGMHDKDPMMERHSRRIRATMGRMGRGINPAGV